MSKNGKKEDSPFIMALKRNTQTAYGSVPLTNNDESRNIGASGGLPDKPTAPVNSDTSMSTSKVFNNNQTPSITYCIHGADQVEVRDHCHRPRLDGIDKKARKKLIIASVLCLIFMIIELIGGTLANSLAIATDAAHLLTDLAGFMISLLAIWLAGRPSTQRLSFGWYRAEVIGALASIVLIWFITAILVWLAIERIINRDFEVNASIMLITSGFAILVNIIMGAQLHHGHSHASIMGHGHSHGAGPVKKKKKMLTKQKKTAPEAGAWTTPTTTKQSDDVAIGVDPTAAVERSEDGVAATAENLRTSRVSEDVNINVRAAYIHVLGDVVQSIGVFVAAIIIFFRPDWVIIDPICTFIFSVIVLFTTFTILKDAILVLMEGTPNYMEYAEVMQIFKQIDGVERVHNLRIWALSINKVALSAHLAIRSNADSQRILEAANTVVHKRYNFFETTIQIEEYSSSMESCQQCTTPVP